MFGIPGMVVCITDHTASRGKIVDSGAMKTNTRMYLIYPIVMLDIEVCIYFALIAVWRAMSGTIEYDSI